jgi:4-amino-4-deoxy-L-arabinose transferase-like glycosyltransferase
MNKRPAASYSSFIIHHSSFVLLVVLYVAARLWRLTDSCLWFDEIFGVHAARHTWDGLWSFVAADLIHPPLFYALLKIWVAVGGETLQWLRLFPLLASVACLLPFFLLARELRLDAAPTRLALLLMATNGYLIKYAQEVRMYSLLLFFTLASLWLFVRFLKESGEARKLLPLALTVCNLLLVYTHYYGWLVVVAEAAFLLLEARRRLKPFLFSAAALVVCFAPWIYACAAAAREGSGLAQNIGWIERPAPSEVAQFFALLQEPFYFRQSTHQPLFARWGVFAGLLLLGLPVALLVLRELTEALRRRRQRHRAAPAQGTAKPPDTFERQETEPAHDASTRRDASLPLRASPSESSLTPDDTSLRFLIFFSFIPPALAFLASYALPHSVWGTRHLIISAAPYMMLVAIALTRVRALWLRSTLLIILCCWFFFAGVLTMLRREDTHIWCAWESLAAPLAREETSEARPATIYAFEDLVAYHLWFALSGERERFRVSVVKGLPGLSEDPAYFLPRGFGEVAIRGQHALEGERFWAAFRDAAWDEGRQPLKLLKERGYRAEKVFETSAQGQRAFLVLFERAP